MGIGDWGLGIGLRAAGKAVLETRGGRRPARGVQGLHERGARGGRRALGALTRLRRLQAGAARVPRLAARALGDQDRRAGRRQGGPGARHARRGRGDVAPSCRARPSATPGGRWSSKRASSGEECSFLVFCDGRAWCRWPGAGLQADRRRRPRPQHRRHGHVLAAAAVDAARSTGVMDEAVEPMVAGCAAGDRLPRRALRRHHAHRRRAEGLEYNVRFGDPETQVVLPLLSDDSPPCSWPWPTGGSTRRRRAFGRRRGVRRAGRARATPSAADRATSSRASTSRPAPSRSRGSPSSTPAPPARRRRAIRHRRRPGARRDRARPRPGRGPAQRAYAAARTVDWEGMQMPPRHRRLAAARRSGRRRPMIPRYSPADMAALFSDEARFAMWLEVELLAVEAQAEVGVVPAEDAAVPGQGAEGGRGLRRRRARAREGDRPRRGRLRRRGPGADRARPPGRTSTSGSPPRTWSTPHSAPP